MLNKKKSTTNWKNIIVIDDARKEIAHFELDEMARIKNKLTPSRKISAFMKQISINNDIKKANGIYQIVAKKPVLSFSGNIDIFSIPNDSNVKSESSDKKSEPADLSYNLKNKISDEAEIKNFLMDEINQSNSFGFLDFKPEDLEIDNEFINIFEI